MRRLGRETCNRLRSTTIVFFVAGVASACRIAGHEVVQNRVVVAAGAVSNVTVSCPAGKKVLGGGFNIETPEDVKIFASDPSDGKGNLISTGWHVMVRNAGTVARQTTAIAICADAR
jgi:hypothetical protein